MLEPKKWRSPVDESFDEGYGRGLVLGHVKSEIKFLDFLSRERKRLEAKESLSDDEAKRLDAVKSCQKGFLGELPYRKEEAEAMDRLREGRTRTEGEIAKTILSTTEYYMGLRIW